jgi:hypothetical protein
MNSNSSNRDQKRDPESTIELAPDSKHGTEGQAAHGGRQVGPNSDDAGKPQAPQTGEPIDHAH